MFCENEDHFFDAIFEFVKAPGGLSRTFSVLLKIAACYELFQAFN